MAQPRVFLSSTFYDLRQVREDLERSIRELGYEPVRHEVGAIPYGKSERLESAAYCEVELCDILVCIIGGRFGAESKDDPGRSITQNELKRALEIGVQVFIFVEKSVLAEFSTYELNKANVDVKYRFVDDVRVFSFLEELYGLPRNNPITGFEIASDISNFLRQQFAGLFYRFLQQDKRSTELRVLDEINTVAKTLRDLVTFLTEERKKGDDAIKNILVANHPAFRRLRELTNTSYRVFFTTKKEFGDWMKARSWSPIKKENLDADSVEEWFKKGDETYLKVTKPLFDAQGRLIVFSSEWNDEWSTVQPVPPE
ncbi:MAG: DUF4062 domain-containing protein [Nitrospinota bacterium]